MARDTQQKAAEALIKAKLDAEAEALPASIRQQLQHRRLQAMNQAQSPSHWGARWALAGSLAAVTLLVVLMLPRQSADYPDLAALPPAVMEDPQLLDDLDFFYWLLEEQSEAL